MRESDVSREKQAFMKRHPVPPVQHAADGSAIANGVVYRSPQSGQLWVRVECPVCGRGMRHSWTPGDNYSGRASHCWWAEEHPQCPTSYVIEVDPDTEPELRVYPIFHGG